eukprot:533773-Alexandrium_andersonii.AAC.1
MAAQLDLVAAGPSGVERLGRLQLGPKVRHVVDHGVRPGLENLAHSRGLTLDAGETEIVGMPVHP